MGTNYYLQREPKICPHCNHDSGPPPLHIGKSSGGWCFSLHVEPSNPAHPQSLEDWEELFNEWGTKIMDEYDNILTPQQMSSKIRDRSWCRSESYPPLGYDSWDVFHAKNGSTMGPKGLLRHKLNEHCIAHGEGTWDLIVGEFS